MADFYNHKLPFNPDNALLIVADDWPSLRRVDIARLLDSYDVEHWPALFDRIRERRPELQAGTEHEADCIIAERWPEYIADQPLDPRGYARRVAVLEYLHGLTRGDAQGVAELEFSRAAAEGGAK